ncbi:hypothetical protein QBC33DRAFT_774 [Phialemonium atrogriseum]|uniref:60S ribosome subunit biogenesis protein NIP7 n=1 Tax=Phialemonium atrogriseum TaxID=1093897 RepID=A0AAJ0C8Z4_9PEZI|nr:uncharacterized protein QBC33DRAFT_774 [Phialemonium atrogriseum]KAK1772171.1 hypothetical protein QBC33DRAFT_774 [Phialemonium atrogriseum]
MRPLTEPETRALFKKLANFAGPSLKELIAPVDNSPDADRFVFRLNHRDRIFYVRLSHANLASSISRDKLLSLGVCLGKFTKTGKVRLHITALPILAKYARHKIWIRPNGVMPFLYGGNICKAHVGRWPENCPEHEEVVICSMDDIPLGFGVTARSTTEMKSLDPTAVVCFRQADCGEYLRDEDTLFAAR